MAVPSSQKPQSTLPSDDESRHITGTNADDEEAIEHQASAQAQEILAAERDAALGRRTARPTDTSAANKQASGNGLRSLAAAEQTTANPWQTRLGGSKQKNKNNPKKGKTSKRNKRIATAAFMLIVSSVLGIAVFFIFLPMKIVSWVENLKESASHLVQRPAQARIQYLVTRHIAGKIVAGNDDNEYDRYVCPSGGIACSVFQTWRVNKFEEKLGLTIESNRTGNGRATSWKVTTSENVTIQGEGGDFEEIVKQVTQQIDGTRVFRQWLKEEVAKETHWYNVLQRRAQRKMLMRKYGVTNWRGPEKVDNKFDSYADYKEAVKLKMKKTLSLASLGRVLKRIPSIVGCITSSDNNGCKNLQTEEAPPPEKPREASDDQKTQQALDAAADGVDAIEGEGGNLDVEKVIDEAMAENGNATGKELTKAIRSKVTRILLAAGVAGIGIIDILADIVEKIEAGDPNAAFEHKNEIAYAGYATEFMTISHKIQEGDLDPETAQAAAEIITNLEQSPLAQHEMGLAPDLGKEGHPVWRDCDSDGALEKLQPGEYVCPNKKVAVDATELITSWPAWDNVIVPAANAWNYSVGAVFDFFNDIVGGILDAVGINKLIDWLTEITGLQDLLASVMDSIMEMFISSPITGTEEDGDAYDAGSIGVKVAYNGMLKNGVDQEGNGMGLGGQVLTTAQLAEINQAEARDRQEEFASKSLMARLFDPYLTGSATNTLLARLPSNVSNIFHSPIANLATLAAPSAGAFPFRAENPAGINIHGYTENSPALTAPPEAYTEETCKQLSEARDASYERRDGEITPGYHAVDGCALERVVRISVAAKYTDKFDSEFQLYQGESNNASAPAGPPGETKKEGEGFSLKDNTDYTGTTCAAGSKETRIYTHPKRGFKIRLCQIKSMEVASIVSDKVVKMAQDAAGSGVELNGGSFRSYEDQINTRRNNCTGDPLDENASCSPPTAVPGNSQHERGLAIDFSAGGTISSGSPQFNWLKANAARYGYYNLPSEPWHWSTSGY